MALPFKRSGGGFLNGVAGTIVGYTIEAKTWDATKKAPDGYTTASVELNIKQDGADEPVSQFLQAGFLYDGQSVSDDGQELVAEDDASMIAADSEFGRFLQSAVDAGLDETPLVEANLRNFSALVNQRFVFKREVDKEGTEKFGKRKGKDGKEYNRDFLLVGEYLGQVEAKAGKKAAKTAKSAAPASKSAAKSNGAAKNADADAQIEQAESVLLSILADVKDNRVDRNGLSAKIVRYSTENKFSDDAAEHNAIREALRKLIGSEDFLSREAGWTYDAKSKGQPVGLA